MKVLIIPEDQSLDQYIVKPIVEVMLADAEIPARVDVLAEPRLRGASMALDAEMIARIVSDNPMVDLFLLVIDRDCDREGNERQAVARQEEHPQKLITCLAIQEVEVWMLALYAEELGARFTEVRAHCDPKEAWAEPLLDKLGREGPGRGRKRAMRALAGNFKRVRSRCPELAALQSAIKAFRKTT